MATASMSELTRTQKRDVGKATLERLEARYIDSRASRKDKIKQAENRELLLPLLDALKKLRADRAARATWAAQAKVAEEGEPEVG